MKLMLIGLLLATSSVFASKAKFCLQGDLVVAATGDSVSSISCEVEQTLRWEDFTALFICSFGENGEDEIYSYATRLGSNMAGTAWTDYSLSSYYDLGRFLQRGLGIENLKRAQDIRVMYSERNLWIKDESIIVETDNQIYKLLLNAYLGKCSTLTSAQ